MITIKLPYKTSTEGLEIINQYRKLYSTILRSVYNQKKKESSDKEVRLYMKSLNNQEDINCWFIESALYESKTLIKSGKENIIFGSRKQFIRRCKGLISNNEYKEFRLSKFYSVGQAKETGNRMFRLNIIDDNNIIFKPKFGTKVILELPKLKKHYLKQLSELEILSKNKEKPFTVKLDNEFIYISFEEIRNKDLLVGLKERFLSIDQNPNHIGLSICEYNEANDINKTNNNDKTNEADNININPYRIIHTCEFDLTEMIKANIDNQNKIKFETVEICKKIINIAIHYKCKYVFLEDLCMVGKDHKKGKSLNRLINNSWFRDLVVNNLQKRCNIFGIKSFLVNPAYSSYIGNLQHDYSDPINASLEIGRRAYEIIILRNKDGFYPRFELKQSILHQWKEMDIDIFKSWKELFSHIKNLKLRYRVSMEDAEKHHVVFRQKYSKPIGLFAYICK